MAVVAVAGLALAEAFHVTLLVDPVDSIGARGLAAWVGVGLLVADIVLPVPSSVVMLAHGALLGVIPVPPSPFSAAPETLWSAS